MVTVQNADIELQADSLYIKDIMAAWIGHNSGVDQQENADIEPVPAYRTEPKKMTAQELGNYAAVAGAVVILAALSVRAIF